MKKHFLFAALAGLMTFAACDSDNEIGIKAGEEDIYNAEYTPHRGIKLGATQQEISAEMNKFAWKMFAKSFEDKTETNLMASPYSLIQNLLMLSNGVEGEALEEIKSVLDVEEFSMEEMNEYILQLNNGMAEADARTKFRSDNALWYKKGMNMEADFADNIRKYYKAETFAAPMNGKTLTAINKWAKERTYGRIPKALDELPEGAKAVLMNTVYFRGLWADERSGEDVENGVFHSENGKEQQARMVKYFARAQYKEGETYQATPRFFGNASFLMDFILPKEGSAPAEALAEYMKDQDKQWELWDVKLTFPCFESASKLSLTKMLKVMGINRVFDSAYADDLRLFDDPIFVNTVLQKTSITVDEHGAEAAAVTYEMWDDAAPPREVETAIMTVDRPFFYAIRQSNVGTPLFIGYQGSVAK